MIYATNSDLTKFYAQALEFGVSDWADEIALAQADVILAVKTKWFFVEFGSLRTRGMVVQPVFNEDLLTPEQWTTAVVYRALSAYILPKLSNFRPEGDAFQVAASFFKERYVEELELQIAGGVEYDLNNDGTVSEAEKFPTLTNRLYR